jgi:molecular chaperone GrpE
MKWLTKWVLANEFVIDEGREVIYTTAAEERAEPADLRTLISEIMVENERLVALTSKLKQETEQSEEIVEFVKGMLPFLDNFERVLGMARNRLHSPELDTWLKSVEALYFRIVRILEKYGLIHMEVVGQTVNLDYHDVVEYRPTMDYPHNTVMKERQKGYVFRGRLIRDAKVVVAYNERR